ncbi:MAG: hypothetical protein WCJ58_06290 [bacterium]
MGENNRGSGIVGPIDQLPMREESPYFPDGDAPWGRFYFNGALRAAGVFFILFSELVKALFPKDWEIFKDRKGWNSRIGGEGNRIAQPTEPNLTPWDGFNAAKAILTPPFIKTREDKALELGCLMLALIGVMTACGGLLNIDRIWEFAVDRIPQPPSPLQIKPANILPSPQTEPEWVQGPDGFPIMPKEYLIKPILPADPYQGRTPQERTELRAAEAEAAEVRMKELHKAYRARQASRREAQWLAYQARKCAEIGLMVKTRCFFSNFAFDF